MGIANIAATNMEHLCTCSAHGYSQSERWGSSSRGSCYVSCEGHTSEFYKGDRDCSSSVCDSWQEALKGTAYEGVLDGATYTGNMRSVFINSGLFEWEPMSFIAQRGDIYLNESDHTAMCLDDGSGSYGYDCLGEFSISETGGIYGASGDQTGSESSIHSYYDFPWDGILHYNGKADDSSAVSSSGDSDSGGSYGKPTAPRYRVYNKESGWLPWMEGLTDTGGSSDDFAGEKGCWIYDFEAENLGSNGWFQINLQGNEELPRNTRNTAHEKPIIGLTIYYDTDTSKTGGVYYAAHYRVHWLGSNPDWGKWEYDDNDDGAGNCCDPIDMVQLDLDFSD